MVKKILVVLALLGCLASLLFGKLYFTQHIDYYTEQLNRKLAQKYGSQYRVTAAFFSAKQEIPSVSSYDKNRILWLGDKIKAAVLPRALKYGTILVSHKYIKDVLINFGIQSEVFPLFATDLPESEKQSEKFFALVGNPPFLEEILQKQGVPYKKFKISQLDELRRNMGNISAISVYPPQLPHINVIHPILVDAALYGTPITGMVATGNNLTLFSDNVYYYRNENEAADFVHKLQRGEYLSKARENYQFAKEYLTLEKAIERLEDIMNNKKRYEDAVQIDIGTPAGDYNSGDYWLGKDLALAFQKRNHKTREVYIDSVFKPATAVNIVMRGNLTNAAYNRNGRLNILYLAWSNLKVNGNETTMPIEKYVDMVITKSKGYDLLAVSSQKVVSALRDKGIDAFYIPEFTNSEKFYYEAGHAPSSEVLFVGNFHFQRQGPLALLRRNMPLTIYGKGWPEGVAVAGQYIDNNILRRYYSSAKIVLNDTKQNMRDFGFVPTRLYDATASGAFIISDYIPEIEALYGDCVPMWKTEDELVHLVNYYLQNDEERKQKSACAQKITLENFTADAIVRQFDELIQSYRQN